MRRVSPNLNLSPVMRAVFSAMRAAFYAIEGNPASAAALVAGIALVGSCFTMFRANYR